MSHENDQILPFQLGKAKNRPLTDQEKLVYAYHHFEAGRNEEAKRLLGQLSSGYMSTNLYKDLCRALLCWATSQKTGNEDHRKESEFYLIVYRLVRKISGENLVFKNSGYFVELKDTLFKDFRI